MAAGFHLWRRERQAVQELEDVAIRHATEHGFGLLLNLGAIHRSWLLSEQAAGEESLAQMRQGLAGYRAIGAELRIPAFLALLAEVYEKLKRPGEGLSVVAEALAVGEHTEQHYWEAELHRLKGTLTLQSETGQVTRESGGRQGKSTVTNLQSPMPGTSVERDAESWFLKAVEIARRQRARSFELRAAVSLSRLWAGQGKTMEAHASLSEVYNWFTEGFDTADVSEARALLKELESRASGKSRAGSRQSSGTPTARPRPAGEK